MFNSRCEDIIHPALLSTDLVPNVEMATPSCGTCGAEVSQHDGRQHRAPAALHYHHAQLLIDSLGDDNLDKRGD